MSDDKRALKSYIWHSEQCFFVSTIERDSSAAEMPPRRYYETIAWTYDWDTKERGTIVAMDGCGNAFDQHYRMCEQLYIHGKVTVDD